MCGIYARVGTHKIKESCQRLKKLSYRGYDAHGYRVVCNGGLYAYTHKRLGEIKPTGGADAQLFLGHTRWATSGTNHEELAHPHNFDNNYIVHNGILNCPPDNQAVETDSQIIPVLINKYITDEKSIDALELALEELYKYNTEIGAIVYYDETHGHTKELIVYTDSLPLFTNCRGVVASDTSAFEDDENIYAVPKHIAFTLTEEGLIDNGLVAIGLEKASRKKSDKTKHTENFTLNEIAEQADLIKEIEQRNVSPLTDLIYSDRRIMTIACGSSHYAGMLGGLYLGNTGVRCNQRYASEIQDGLYYSDEYTTHMLISQSGETKDVIDSAKIIKKGFALINRSNSSLSHIFPSYMMGVGEEIGVAATKSFMATALLMYKCGHITSFKNLATCVRDLTSPQTSGIIKGYAKQFKNYRNMLILGTGLNYPIALEAALKIKEVSYIHAEGMPSSEIKHGPLALIDDDTLSVCIVDKTDPKVVESIRNIEQIKTRGGEVLVIGNNNYTSKNQILTIPCDNKDLQPLVNLVVLQLFACYLAEAKGLNVDKPRNLAKSVTV